MSKDSGAKEARQQLIQEQQRQADIRKGIADVNTTFDDQFDDRFYQGRRDAYTNYATPQLDEQNTKATRELVYSMARSGLLNSSARGTQGAEQQRIFDLGKQGIADTAISEAAKAKSSVEDARANLIQGVSAAGSSAGAVTNALNRASALSQPAAYSPLSDAFAGFTNALGQQASREQAFASGSPFSPRYNTGLFGVPSSATKVT